MQYITRLIVGREVERRVNLVVDVEGYRVRRERSLRKLAERMAERAVTTGRRQVLEPMPAAERRIIHVALRDRTDVMTESIGQDENRKVTISLRESN
jgi:spoIIIJ-associated protein